MSQSKIRVKLVIAAGVAGASLLGATFVGCQSSPQSQAQNGPYGQYNGNQFGGAPNAQQASPYGAPPQMASAAVPGSVMPQGQQAFLNETQRIGTQQNLTPQDVIAMSRSGLPDAQIAAAVQQRGAALRAMPGISQYLTQNGVNPAVLGLIQPVGAFPGQSAPQVAMNDPQAAYGATLSRPAFNAAPASGVTSAVYPTAQADAGQLQSATYESSLTTPALDPTAPAANGQSWRAMPH